MIIGRGRIFNCSTIIYNSSQKIKSFFKNVYLSYLWNCIKICNFFLYLVIGGGVYRLVYERNDSLSIASEITRINNNISTAYSACLDKGATMPQTQNSANLADTISTIQEGAATPEKKDVNFYDYDGALLYSYTVQEAQSLTALPALPQHSGLVAQEWNWTLAEIQSHLATGQTITVGCNYDTDDGSTKFYFAVRKGTRISTLSFSVKMQAETSATVYWGDGTSSTLNNPETSEAYVVAEKTDYAEAAEDTELCVKISSGHFYLSRNAQNSSIFGGGKIPVLTRAHLGSNCTGVGSYAFYNMFALSSVSFANTLIRTGDCCFYGCYNMPFAVLPRGMTVIGDYYFRDCYNIKRVSVPASVVTIGSYAFGMCYSLENVTLPVGLSNLSTYAINQCNKLRSISVPSAVGVVKGGTFNTCRVLSYVQLGEGIREIEAYAFNANGSLTYIKIPASVRQIGQSAFSNSLLYELDMTAFTDPSAIPSMESISAFSSTFSFVKISVANQEMLSAFSSATNWSTFADKMVIKEASA